jgi:hypothetical protein
MTCFFLVGQGLELFEDRFQFLFGQVVAQGLEMGVQGVAARMLAQDQLVAAQADGLGLHDLIGHGIFEHAVLVNAGFVGKGIGADDRLVGLDHDAGDHAYQTAAGEMCSVRMPVSKGMRFWRV